MGSGLGRLNVGWCLRSRTCRSTRVNTWPSSRARRPNRLIALRAVRPFGRYRSRTPRPGGRRAATKGRLPAHARSEARTARPTTGRGPHPAERRRAKTPTQPGPRGEGATNGQSTAARRTGKKPGQKPAAGRRRGTARRGRHPRGERGQTRRRGESSEARTAPRRAPGSHGSRDLADRRRKPGPPSGLDSPHRCALCTVQRSSPEAGEPRRRRARERTQAGKPKPRRKGRRPRTSPTHRRAPAYLRGRARRGEAGPGHEQSHRGSRRQKERKRAAGNTTDTSDQTSTRRRERGARRRHATERRPAETGREHRANRRRGGRHGGARPTDGRKPTKSSAEGTRPTATRRPTGAKAKSNGAPTNPKSGRRAPRNAGTGEPPERRTTGSYGVSRSRHVRAHVCSMRIESSRAASCSCAST